MDISISFSAIQNTITQFMSRYHFIIFFVVAAGALGAAVLLLSNTVVSSDNPVNYTSTVNNVGFDTDNKDTIKRLQALKEPGQETEKLPITGRESPFTE